MAIGALFVVSGAAALIYEVLWLKQLGLLFGNGAQATATTLAVFFLGLSAGAHTCGARASRSHNPLRAYALLEVAIAACALLYFVLLDAYSLVYEPLAVAVGSGSLAFTAAKLILAVMILMPPAFCMGGTLPFMTEYLVRRRRNLGSSFSWLYAWNTIGGAAGAFAAAFLLPSALGFTRSYLVAIAINLSVGALAWALSRQLSQVAQPATDRRADSKEAWAAPKLIWALAFFSGAATLGLEVLWTRMFAQVLHNSVYSFATILITFLLTIALGASLANRLCRQRTGPAVVLPWLLVFAGLGAGVSPLLFHVATSGMSYVAPTAGWWRYVLSVFATSGAVLLIPGVCIGTVFPYLARVVGNGTANPGLTAGRLTGWNTFGAIVGSLASGFLLIEVLGLYGSVRSIALSYFLVAMLLAPQGDSRFRVHLAVAMAAVLIIFDPTRLPIVNVAQKNEFVREQWETGQAVVSVTQAGTNLLLKVDNYYSLGGTSARTYEETQADVPLIIHPRPSAVFFLGMGTGITAGASLRHAVETVTVAELIPAVITAARRHFEPYTNGLFEDPRVRIVAEDGRQYLLTTADRFDVIISDLFIPWQAGTGTLYSREHFRLARSRLRPGGLFAQWLPLYQLTRSEALIVMRTMLEEFPQVTLWRGDFMPDNSIVALIGQDDGAQLDPEVLTANFRRRRKTDELPRDLAVAFTGLFYAGNLTANSDLFTDVPIDSDDRPLIEYRSPVAQREHFGGGVPWFISFELAEFQNLLAQRLPPARDPYLERLADTERDYAQAGLHLFEAVLFNAAGRRDEAQRRAAAFRENVPDEVYKVFRRDIEGDHEAAPSQEQR